MFCNNCGASLVEGARFCAKCGQKVADISGHDMTPEVDWIRLVSAFANSTDERQKNAAFEALYHASYKSVYAYVYRDARNVDIIEDVLQVAYVACWNKIEQLDNATRFLPWMKQIAHRAYLDMAGKESRTDLFGVVSDDEGNETPAEEILADEALPLPEDAYANDELHRLLINAIDELSEGQRIVMKGYYFDGKSVQALADELLIPANTVKTNLARGRKNMESRISAHANAYGLKLVPIAIIPFMALLGKEDVYACEAAAVSATGAATLASIKTAIGLHIAGGAAAGSAGAAGSGVAVGSEAASAAGAGGTGTAGAGVTAGTTSAAGTGASAAAGTAGAVGTSAATITGTATAVGSGIVVKVGAGVIAAAMAAGGAGVAYRNMNNDNHVTQESSAAVASDMEEDEQTPLVPEEPATIETLCDRALAELGQAETTQVTSPYTVQTLEGGFTGVTLEGFSGDVGVIAAYRKDLDADGEDELLVLNRQLGEQYGNSVWQIYMRVYDTEDPENQPDGIRIMSFKESGISMEPDTMMLSVYLKDLGDSVEILSSYSDYYYINVSGGTEELAGFQYRDGQLTQVDDVLFGGSDSYGEGQDPEVQSSMQNMGLYTSAAALEEANDLLYGDDALCAYLSSDEEGITELLRWESSSTLLSSEENVYDMTIGELSGYTMTLTLVNKDPEDTVYVAE